MSLLMHTMGSHYTTLDTLRTLPTPEAMGTRHKPIPHHILVDEILDQVADRGWSVKKMKLGVSAKGRKLFGIMDLIGPETADQHHEMGSAFGFRSSVNQTMAIRGVAGARVFICDNMMMSGEEWVLRHKLTTRLNLPELVSKGLNKFIDQQRLLQVDINTMRQQYVDDADAKIHLFDIFNAGALPLHLFDDVSRLYFHPQQEHSDCKPRTLLGLSNACTRAVQLLKKPAAQFNASVDIGRHFRLAVQ